MLQIELYNNVFCRKNSSTAWCEYDDLQNILNKRVSAS